MKKISIVIPAYNEEGNVVLIQWKNKEVYQQLLNSKDDQIALLKEMLNLKK